MSLSRRSGWRAASFGWRWRQRWRQLPRWFGPVVLLLIAIGVASWPRPTVATFRGTAVTIDGDTIDVGGARIRILDIDAPERDQPCVYPDGVTWQCGGRAASALAGRLGRRTVTCAATGNDRYSRWLAHCEVAGEDVALWMIGNGWSVPYSECFCIVVRAVSLFARFRKAGVWSSTFDNPSDWRRANP